MQKLSFALSVLVLPFAFHSIQSQAAQTKTGTATVSGRVTLKGEPARGVMVVLQAQSQGAPNALRARADESGRFHFTGVSAGRYSVYAVAPGYVSPGDVSYGMRGKSLILADGDKVENLDLEIKRGGVITGKVIDSQGRPVIEENINLTKLDANNRPMGPYFYNVSSGYDGYRTDDRGVYRIYGTPEGRYLVSVGYVESPGSATIISRREFYPRVFYPDATSESDAKAIDVTEGSEASNIDLTVPDPKQTRDVSGRVVDAGSGQPVAGVEVVVGGVMGNGRYVGGYMGIGERSKPNGEFRLFGVAPGKRAILTLSDEASGGFISDPVIIDIGEEEVTGVELKVRPGAAISGVVVIEGTNDPKIQAKLSQISLTAAVMTSQNTAPPTRSGYVRANADGSFHFGGLHPGKATISVSQAANARDLVMSRVERNGAPVSDGIDVEAGEHVTGVRVVLVRGPLAIRGELRVVGGPAPAGCRFFVSPRRVDQPMPNLPGAEVDARGQFAIENLPPGEYEIKVTPFFYPNGQPASPEILRRINSSVERVILSAGVTPPIVITINLDGKEKEQ
jgi:protocatechuate 3,4-dioxygenase beta subunit